MKRRKFDNQSTSSSEVPPKKPKPLQGKVKKGSFEHRFERRRYLNQLVQELEKSPASDMECKRQIMANLANFGYDPYNYQFFGEIGVIPMFLAEINVNRDEILTEFAMGAICNCASDKRMQKEILKNDGILLVKRHTYSSSLETVLSALTTLIYLTTSEVTVKNALKSDSDFLENISTLSRSHNDKRVTNVAVILFEHLNT